MSYDRDEWHSDGTYRATGGAQEPWAEEKTGWFAEFAFVFSFMVALEALIYMALCFGFWEWLVLEWGLVRGLILMNMLVAFAAACSSSYD